MNETQQIEKYVFNRLLPEDKLVMDARLILDPSFQHKLKWQQQAYYLIQQYGRKKLKEEIRTVQEQVFSENRFSHFREKINKIFK